MQIVCLHRAGMRSLNNSVKDMQCSSFPAFYTKKIKKMLCFCPI